MHIHEKHQGQSCLYLMTEDIQQRAKAICREASVARRRAQNIRQPSQQARHMRQAAQGERALWRDHITASQCLLSSESP